MFRPNLHLEVWRAVNEPQKRQHLTRLLGEIEGAGIVYGASVRQVDLLHGLLAGLGFNVGKHHGRMPTKQRQESEDRFLAGELHAIVATNTIGARADKPDVRFVIHYAMPGSLDSYYEEAGRAGRDGKPARCALLYKLEDRRTPLLVLEGQYPRSDEIQSVCHALERSGLDGGAMPIGALKEATPAVTDTTLRVVLQLLKKLGVIREQRGGRIVLLKPGLSCGALDELLNRYKEQHAVDHERLNKMVEYGQSARCRWKFLLEYFGETVEWDRCEHCDNCRSLGEDRTVSASAHSEAADG